MTPGVVSFTFCTNFTLINRVSNVCTTIRLLRRTFRHHALYFSSFTGNKTSILSDITHTFQRTLNSVTPDSRFFWNERPLAHLSNDLLLQYSPPCTSAFVSCSNISINQDLSAPLSYRQILISRRSKYEAGTRFTKRGADNSGNVANFAETEQIILINGTLFSHVQIRGSIPLKWSSPADVINYNPPVRLGVDPIAHAKSLRAHLVELWRLYGSSIIFVNLIDKIDHQGRLGRAFDAVLSAVLDVWSRAGGKADHIWFDFHAECKSRGKYTNLIKLLNLCRPSLDSQKFLILNTTSGRINSLQNGIIRTNCMDCLDRTNVVQTILARYMLFQALLEVKRSQKRLIPIANIVAFRKKNPLSLPWSQAETAHRLLWADNADHISMLYAGTNALKRGFTRTGMRTIGGKMEDGVNSLTRYYKNNFEDIRRQDGIDLMVGERNPRVKNQKDFNAPSMGNTSSNSTKYDLIMKEIDRRMSGVYPLWVEESEDNDEAKDTQKDAMEVLTVGNKLKILAIIFAMVKAPNVASFIILCLLLPGLVS